MKKAFADDYFNNGRFEMTRFGTNVMLKNIMTPIQHSEYVDSFANKYDDIKREIDTLVSNLRQKVILCEPLKLLSFSSGRNLYSMLGKSSEIEMSADDFGTQRMTEYLQSIIVSSPCSYEESPEETDPSTQFFDIQNDIDFLFKRINAFYYSWGMHISKSYESTNDGLISTIVESQMLFNVRGKRYQIFQNEYLEALLSVHEEVFMSLFGISARSVIDGLNKLEYALSQAKFDAFNQFYDQFEEFQQADTDLDEWADAHRESAQESINKMFGYKLHDVCDLTGWPVAFASEMAFEINEDSSFFSRSEYPGWPIIDLPIQKRPFVKIADTVYCFDYYSVMDNIYRVIQKCVTRNRTDYNWKDNQQQASEQMVERIFEQILPSCTVYVNNFYPTKASLKQMAENDLLVFYKDVLLIVEVKAGSFVYTPPITDFEAHIKSYKSLIEDPNLQCQRTIDYLYSATKPPIYGKDKNIKTTIDMSSISDVFMLSITIDNINEFAARAEKLGFLKINKNIICLSIDDLMVYRSYFDSPLVFLHFLKQRKNATNEMKIALNDELDHLGMYIKHNCYPLYVKNFPSDSKTNFFGYREELDHYFCELYHPHLHPSKPVRQLPSVICQILSFLENRCIQNTIDTASYLLDFSTDAKTQFETGVSKIIERQKQSKKQNAIHAAGLGDSLRYTCFVNIPDIITISYQEKFDYALSSLIKNSEENRVLIDLTFDEHDILQDFSFQRINPTDCPPDKYDQILSLGVEIANARVERYAQLGPGKVGRNDKCPCGSGKKYKYCCGQK